MKKSTRKAPIKHKSVGKPFLLVLTTVIESYETEAAARSALSKYKKLGPGSALVVIKEKASYK